ncbi:sentrin-specific protease 1 isoform X1 [Oreochromis niloticus]|uniref:sentrin-specific protease 1 isoform X1 n=1 Tax=Oreochromis niloticus TaxID=8128 RepID=UPI0009055AC2|nr:sentrin-specific protease 1 isoform X1 [Oreochromis niloticus]
MPRVPHRGSKKTAATLPTAQPGPAAPQAAAAPASALASQATAAPVAVAPPPPPPRATQPTAPMASLTSLSVQTQHPSPVPQGIAITVSDPESGATPQKENEPATSATAPEYATAVQTESQTAADPASKTITADQASQTTTADQASQTTTADPASQTTAAADPSSQTTAPNATTTQASAPQITAQQSTAQTMEATVPLVTPAPATATQASPAPPPASPSQRYTEPVAEKYIMDAWTGKSPHVLLSKIGAYKLFYWDIQQIGLDMELESESINAYLAIMVRQCNRHNSAKAAFIDSFSMTAIWKRKAPRLKIKPMEHEVILGIVNEHHHWTLVVIYPQEKKSLYLDPLGETKQGIQNCLESTRGFMQKKGCNVSRWTCDTVKHPKQLDATSCGVFALKFAEKILQKESIDFPSTKKAINTHRLQIATTLLLETDDLTNICLFCGEEEHETDNKWIQCEMCLRWFHQLCMKSPPPEDLFICFACT